MCSINLIVFAREQNYYYYLILSSVWSTSYSLFFKHSFNIISTLWILSCLTPNAFEFTKLLWSQGVHEVFCLELSPISSYWLAHLSDFHITVLTSSTVSGWLLIFRRVLWIQELSSKEFHKFKRLCSTII